MKSLCLSSGEAPNTGCGHSAFHEVQCYRVSLTSSYSMLISTCVCMPLLVSFRAAGSRQSVSRKLQNGLARSPWVFGSYGASRLCRKLFVNVYAPREIFTVASFCEHIESDSIESDGSAYVLIVGR